MTRNEALATLAEGKAALDALISQLDDTQFERPATIGGGDWSARDLVAHLAWWEEIAQQAVDDWRAGRVPWIEAVFRDGTVDDVNAGNDARTRGQSSAEVRERAARAHASIVATISEMADDEWAEKAFLRRGQAQELRHAAGRHHGRTQAWLRARVCAPARPRGIRQDAPTLIPRGVEGL